MNFHSKTPSSSAALRVERELRRAIIDLTLPGSEAMLPLVEQYREIVRAIDAQGPDRAEQAMRHHLSAMLRALPRIEAEHL